MSDEEESNWTIELETVLIEGCDHGTIKRICKCRPFPSHLRGEVWPICLGVADKRDSMVGFDEFFDMKEQAQVREDCQLLVDKLGNEDEEKLSVACDIESIITFYCKSRGLTYHKEQGWLDLLQPMLALKLGRTDLYNCFYTLHNRYIPRACEKNGPPFHLLRLLLLYHDPELCSLLDTKKVTPDTYALQWFQSLFACRCDLEVTLTMWDVYLQHADPFLIFFLALVILVNAKEQLQTMEAASKQEIVDLLQGLPSALEAEDIEDFCSLALYYSTKTPQSFRREFQGQLFGASQPPVQSADAGDRQTDKPVAQQLCLLVSVEELLSANTNSLSEDSVRYFVVDCRPAEQYNSGHLPTAFHLDANLMLQNPTEFSTSVQALVAAQRHAVAAGSAAAGEHLCFMGSGREEEDQYVNMVVAHFLQRNSLYVSVAKDGYAALHSALTDLQTGLSDHHPTHCIVCNPGNEASDDMSSVTSDREEDGIIGKFSKLSTTVKHKSSGWKEKMISYIKNEQQPVERHVSSSDQGKRYRGLGSVFTIGDESGDEANVSSSEDERKDVVSIETWLKRSEVKHAYQCREVRDTGYMYASIFLDWDFEEATFGDLEPSVCTEGDPMLQGHQYCHLLVTSTHLYVLREIPHRKGMAWIQARRALGSIVKITSKKKHPEFITFKYGCNEEDKGIVVTNVDRFLIPKAGDATKCIKQQIMRVLDSLES